MVRQFQVGNFQYVFLCILVLFLFIVPSLIEKSRGIRFPDTMEIIILLFIFAAEILGEIQEFYVQIPMWDTILGHLALLVSEDDSLFLLFVPPAERRREMEISLWKKFI